MTASNFAASLAAVLKDEGGNDDNPADHGGRTSRGITQREYDAWRAEQHLPPLDVWQAPQTDINLIYRTEYWNPSCDAFPTGLDYLYFDMAVNAGPYRAAVLLQRALGINDDGRIGPVTRQAADAANPRDMIAKYSAAKRACYLSLHQPKFTKGWLNRVAHVQAIADAMINPTTGAA